MTTPDIPCAQPAPTDEQIENAWLEACGAHQSERERVIAFARSMLACGGSRAVLTAAKVALAEAELLLHKAWAEHDLRSIDDGEGVIRDVAKAADRMDAAHSQVVAQLAALAVTSEPDKRTAFEAWAPSVHMRTERWTVNPELYDDEDAISAWQGFQAGATWQQAQAAIPAPEGGERAAFEAWMKGLEGYPYAGKLADRMWQGWQARAALAAPAPQAADHSPDAGKKVGGDQAPAEGDDLDRDEAIRVWRRHCDKFSDALKKEPPSPVIDAMLEFARAHVQPKGIAPATGESTLTDLEHDLRNLHGVYSDGGARRITPEGLHQSVEANRFSKPYWFASSTHKLPAGGRAYCSCCAKPQSEVLHWNLLALCRECVAAAFPEGPTTAAAPSPAPAPVPPEHLPTKAHIRELAQEAMDQVMEQAQVFASAWSLVGGKFDTGNAMSDAEDAKAELRTMVRSLADLAAETVRPVPCAAVVAGDERQDIGGHIRAAANAKVAQQADDDTRRLDYLQKTQATISLVPDGRDGNGTRHAFMVGGWHCSVSRDVRASIDTAMGESQPPVQGSGS